MCWWGSRNWMRFVGETERGRANAERGTAMRARARHRRSRACSAFRLPRSALIGPRRHNFGYVDRGRIGRFASVRSGIRTDPSQWTDERHRRGIAGEERSEEHTSELQSRLHLVCRLLLEKTINANDAEMRPHFRMRSIALFISIPLLRQAFGRSLS